MKNKIYAMIATALLVIGIVLSSSLSSFGVKEWSMLGCFFILGIGSGAFQGASVVRKNQGKISRSALVLRIVASLIVLFAVKGMITGSVPSHLQNEGLSMLAQIAFSISGLFLGRALTTGTLDKSAAERVR